MAASDGPLNNWELRLKQLDEPLRPIANRAVDITQPGWLQILQAAELPLDEAGIRDATEALLYELITGYAKGTDDLREAIRRLFAKYRSFAWAATLPRPSTTAAALRHELILFSMKDQGRDSRDAILLLDEICGEARGAGLETATVLKEVAAMSNTENRFRMGSTRQMLLDRC